MEPDNLAAPGRETLVLSDGTTAELIGRDGGWILEVDGIRQSHVTEPGQPPALASARWMLAALGTDRRKVVHLGGGLLTLPRAVAATNPQAQQTVVELDPVLAALVLERFGIPENVKLEVADARTWLDARGLVESAQATWDALVIDVFAGGRIPPAFTSQECFASARSLLADHGVLIINSVAGGDLTFTRRQIATLRAEFEHVGLIVQNSSLHGLRFGNAILVGSAAPIDAAGIRGALAGDPSRGALVTDLDDLVGAAEVVVDADELWSPEPDLPDAGPALRLLDQARSLGSVFGESPAGEGAADAEPEHGQGDQGRG
ncbi:MAG: fused MFS/spermidine synthase [Nocardioides sp.]|nr:fused MFS/spermidine synthase [Nocardioides sp.]